MKKLIPGAATALAALCGTGVALAQSDTLAPRWTHVSGSENWVGRAVSLGNEGSEVFSALEAGALTARLFAEGTNSTPASPVWQVQDPNTTYYFQVASCESRSLHAVARVESTGTLQRIAVRAFTSGSNVPAWTWASAGQSSTPAAFQVLMPDAGDRVVIVVPGSGGLTEVRVLNSTTGALLNSWSTNLYGPAMTGGVSEDGSALYLSSAMCASVYDTASGALRYQSWILAPVGRIHGFSGDGSTFAYGLPGEVRVFRRGANGTWAQAVTVPLATTATCDTVAISRDGRRLAMAWPSADATASVHAQVVDLPASLAAGTPQIVWSRLLGSAPGWSNLCADLRLSRDGRVAAIGLWGDQGGSCPELVVVGQDGADVRTANLPGSVQRLALSADGRHLAVGSKSVHNTTPASDGRVDYFELGAGDLLIDGIPRSNGPLSVRTRTSPGSPVVLIVGSAGVSAPIPWGAMGYLQVARTGILSLTGLGTADAQGRLTSTFVLPPTSAGTSYWVQALGLNPRRLTEDACKLTVVP